MENKSNVSITPSNPSEKSDAKQDVKSNEDLSINKLSTLQSPENSTKTKKKRNFDELNKFVIKKISLRDNISERRRSQVRKSNKSMNKLLKENLSFCGQEEQNQQFINDLKKSKEDFSKTFKMSKGFTEFVGKNFSSDPMVFISINKFINKVQPITNVNVNKTPLPPKMPKTFKIKKGNFNLDQLNERLKTKALTSNDE